MTTHRNELGERLPSRNIMLTARVAGEDVDMLEALADRWRCSKSEALRRVIREAFRKVNE